MRPFDILLALSTTAVWGFNFVVIRAGLGDFPPLLLAALRFVVTALPAMVLARPALPWGRLAAIAATLYVGQFGCLFTAMKIGMPPGLASVVLQSQAFITISLAALTIGERPTGRKLAGVAVAMAGLGCIASTAGSDGVTVGGLILTLLSAFSWASGNLLVRTARTAAGQPVDPLALTVWAGLLSIVPLGLLSLTLEGSAAIGEALVHMTWRGELSVLYIAVMATLFGFSIWSGLLKRYPAGAVAPFSLLVPLFGTVSAWIVYAERFGALRLAGMALIVTGLVAIVLPARR